MKAGRRIAGVCIALAMTASIFAGCSKKDQKTEIQATKVETQTAERGNLDITGTYIGTVAPHTSVNVTPLVTGTVKTVNVKVGDKVKAGDVLCTFDDTAAELQLKSAQNAVESAQAGKEAAKDQIHAAKKQAEASVTSMEGQIKTLRAQKKSSEKQLEQVKGSLDQLKAASEAAAEAYGAAKGRYDGASQLYLSAQAFLTANPDCKTSGGLAAAASYVAPLAPVAVPSGDSTQAAAVPEPSKEEQAAVKAALAKKEQALALQKALGEIGITVENLDETSINTLKDQMEQAQKASEAASTGYTQAAASVGQLEAAIAQVKAQIEALEDNIDAAEDAANAGGGTKAYDAQIKAAQTGVESAQYQKDLYTVTAPIGGVIESVNVTADEVSAQGMPAFIISDKEAMEVSFYVPEEVRDFLKNGDEVKVEASDGEVKGRVSLIGTAVDQQKGLFEIVAEITGVTDKSLLSNTSVSLSLVTNSVKGEILIPFDAVYYDNDQAYVFIAKKGSDATRAERRDVKTGVYNNEQISIVEGLTGGEEVITTWGAGLKDGAVVEILHPAAENKTGNTTGNTSGNKTAE